MAPYNHIVLVSTGKIQKKREKNNFLYHGMKQFIVFEIMLLFSGLSRKVEFFPK